MIIEACVESYEEAVRAQELGASRLELCACLEVGGTTPDYDLIKKVMETVKIPVKVMIRPRGGNFIYTQKELSTMINNILKCKSLGVEEIVFGILTDNNEMNLTQTKDLAELADPMSITIHKAIDRVVDPEGTIKSLREIPNVVGVLTSGQAPTAVEGIRMLKKMLNSCGEDIELIVAGKVTPENLPFLIDEIGAKAYHGRKIVGSLS